jgi:A/G-specific adenine glycosylase
LARSDPRNPIAVLDAQLTEAARPFVDSRDTRYLTAGNVLTDALNEVRENPAVGRAQSRHAEHDIDAAQKRWLTTNALTWFDLSGRTFPWRERREPYRILIAELLLQRTRADLVLPVYERFLRRYPDARALAKASPQEVVDFLRPLGFLHRSSRLPALAREIVERHGGSVPRSKTALLALPGVGDYVANAVLAIAFGERRPLLDPNVARLVERVFDRPSTRARPRDDRALWQFIEGLLPRRRANEFSLALIDLGALVCRSKRPRCFSCPLRPRCQAFALGRVSPAHPQPPPADP